MEIEYQEVLEYLADREGDEAVLNSYPTFGVASNLTLLGLSPGRVASAALA
jgi:hypothetical protein